MKNKYLKIAIWMIVGCAILNYLAGFLILSTVQNSGTSHNFRSPTFGAPYIDAAITPLVSSARVGEIFKLKVYEDACNNSKSGLSGEFYSGCELSYGPPTLTTIGRIVAVPAYLILLLIESLIFAIIAKILLTVARAIISIFNKLRT